MTIFHNILITISGIVFITAFVTPAFGHVLLLAGIAGVVLGYRDAVRRDNVTLRDFIIDPAIFKEFK